MPKTTSAASPRLKARIAGAFYVITVVAGGIAFVVPSAQAAGIIAGASYIGVTLLFYYLFKPVSRSLSLLAAVLSLVGIAIGPLARVMSYPLGLSMPMTFFGFYCLLIGYLVFRSAYLPHILGVLLAIGGLGYLINSFANFLSLGFAPRLFPYIMLPGFIAETLLCLWLLIVGVDASKWDAQPSVE